MTSTMGTPYEIDTTGKKFFLLEDVGEEPYRLDRMFNQLRLAGKFERCAGVIAADFHNCNPSARASSLTIAEIIHDHIVPYNIPIFKRLSNWTLQTKRGNSAWGTGHNGWYRENDFI
ncbi:hypothetical protein GCM10020331_072120 [Ectobacillus funiculus]